MKPHHHFVLIGRTSTQIAQGVVKAFAHAPLVKVIQSRFGTFGDGESIFELFVDGKLPDHPLAQNLTQTEKRKIRNMMAESHITIVHSASGENVSSRAMSLLHGADYLKQNLGVGSITWIAPQLPYMRNDREFRKTIIDENGRVRTHYQFNAVACDAYPRQLRAMGIDKIVGFEPHSKQGAGYYKKYFGERNAIFVNMGDFFAAQIAADVPALTTDGRCNVMVGSPDGMNKKNDYGIARARGFGRAFYAQTPFATYEREKDFRAIPYMFAIHKERIGPKDTKIVDFHGDVQGKICVLIDDIISSGGTTLDAARALRHRGAISVIAIATHAVLVNGALQKLLESDLIDKVMLADTIPSALDKKDRDYPDHPKLIIQTIAPLVVHHIRQDMGVRLVKSEALTLKAG
jgi:phosphoribosylpyrophosphate synthetase